MQWDDTPNAGFTDGEPWIPVNDDYPEINVANQERSGSVLSYYRDLIALRRGTEALVHGAYDLFHPDDEQLYVYTRTLEGQEIVVAINFSDGDRRARLDPLRAEASLLLSNYDDVADASDGAVELRPYEARVYEQPQ
jgi:glycosidase